MTGDSYNRIDLRQAFRSLVVRHHNRVIANTKRPSALYEYGFAPRWYVARDDVDESALTDMEHQTICPYKVATRTCFELAAVCPSFIIIQRY